jgi:phenylpropionate dioxygenase-like ring-hydroxylating dioxygenase large terminal subunit
MLEDYWHIACRARALRKKPKAITLFSRHVVLFRDEQGSACAMEDRCAHRNMPLHFGKIVDGQLQCPYHGWRYNRNGQVDCIPALCDQGLYRQKIHIPSYPCVEQDGYIWVCLSGRPASSKPPQFPFINEPGWTTFHLQTRFHATVENCLENFLDVPHATFVHRFWFRSPAARAIKAKVRELNDGAVAEYFEEPRNKSLVFGLLSDSKASLRHTDRFIAPSMSRVDYAFSDKRHYVISSFCSPVTENETEVFTVITFKFGSIAPLVRLAFEPLSRLIIKQDVKTLERQQHNVERFGGESFVRIPQDLLRPHIESWRNAIRNGGSPQSGNREMEVELRV